MPHDSPGTLVFRLQTSWRNLNEVTQMQVGSIKIADFRQMRVTRYNLKTVQDRHVGLV